MDLLAGNMWFVLGVLACTGFVKIFTTCTIFRYGIGLGHSGFGFVLAIFSLVLSLVLIEPQLSQLGGEDALSKLKSAQAVESVFRPLIEEKVDKESLKKLLTAQAHIQSHDKTGDRVPPPQDPNVHTTSFLTLLATYLISQFQLAFSAGLIILIPFFVIDLAVTHILMMLGVTQISSESVSLPLKLLLFISVDGWQLLTEKLLGT